MQLPREQDEPRVRRVPEDRLPLVVPGEDARRVGEQQPLARRGRRRRRAGRPRPARAAGRAGARRGGRPARARGQAPAGRSGAGAGPGAVAGGAARLDRERQPRAVPADRHGAAVLEPPEEDLVGERVAHLGLDQPRERPRARRPGRGPARARCAAAAGSSRIATRRSASCASSSRDELADDRLHDRGRQRRERHDRVEPVAELRREEPLDRGPSRGPAPSRAWSAPKPIAPGRRLARAGVRGHDEHDLAEVRLAPRVVGERRVVHHLQEDVEEVRVRLLDLVEEHDARRLAAHRVDQQAPLLEADVPRRRADEARHRVLLHELAHVEAVEVAAELPRELARQLRLADAGRPGEEEAAGRVVGVAEPGARALDRLHDGAHGLLLPEDHARRAPPRARAAAPSPGASPAAPGCAPSARSRARPRRRRRAASSPAAAASRSAAPASSITSTALSGRRCSRRWRAARRTAASSASGAYVTPWCSS